MKRHTMAWAWILLGGMAFVGSAKAAKLFLVANVVGEVSTRTDSGEEAVFGAAKWVPKNVRVFTRARSGVEALSPGLFLRFGEDTVFSFDSDHLQLHRGALLVRLLGSGKDLVVDGPEANLRITGSGSLLLGVPTNGGFKLIGLTGKPSVATGSVPNQRALRPGEVLFAKPLEGGWSDPLHVNLAKLVESSFLISGFTNQVSFDAELARISKNQAHLITKTFRAEIGDAREAASFEVRVIPPDATSESSDSNASTVGVDQPPTDATQLPSYATQPLLSFELPEVPGPALQFHNKEKPEPTLKELFQADQPPLAPPDQPPLAPPDQPLPPLDQPPLAPLDQPPLAPPDQPPLDPPPSDQPPLAPPDQPPPPLAPPDPPLPPLAPPDQLPPAPVPPDQPPIEPAPPKFPGKLFKP